jgi:zinc transport system ATP-binding protein
MSAPLPILDPQPASGHVHGPACNHGSLAVHRDQGDAICLHDVSYRYPAHGASGGEARPAGAAGGWALRNVTLHIEHGCSLGIIGPNGAGKSTLIKLLLGMLKGYQGQVQIMGMTPEQACRRGDVLGYVPQRHDVEWRFPVSVQQVVNMGLTGKTGLLRWFRKEDKDYALHMMEKVGIINLRHRPIGELSGGQQQRAFIARALVARPRVLLLDEPTVGVDEAGQQQFAQLINDLHQSLDLTVLIVSHDLQAIAAGCNRVACLNQRIHYHDAPGKLTQEVLREVFQHDIMSVLNKR